MAEQSQEPAIEQASAATGDQQVTHRDLLPKNLCPSLMMKHILTGSLDDVIHDDRDFPGDGYYWCVRTCREVGPDDELTGPDMCLPGRKCYDGVIE